MPITIKGLVCRLLLAPMSRVICTDEVFQLHNIKRHRLGGGLPSMEIDSKTIISEIDLQLLNQTKMRIIDP